MWLNPLGNKGPSFDPPVGDPACAPTIKTQHTVIKLAFYSCFQSVVFIRGLDKGSEKMSRFAITRHNPPYTGDLI